MLPYLDYEQQRFPIHGGLFHPRGGTARHDAVAWGYARACSDMGMDIIQQTEVTVRLFPEGYHELFNERSDLAAPEFETLRQWLDMRCPARADRPQARDRIASVA